MVKRWMVTARNPDANSPYSDIWIFYVIANGADAALKTAYEHMHPKEMNITEIKEQ